MNHETLDIVAGRTYSTNEALALADVTARQLYSWLSEGAIEPSGAVASGSGTQNRWTAQDVARIVAIGQVARDLRWFGLLMSIELAAMIWEGLVDVPTLTMTRPSVTVHVARSL